MPIFGMNHGEPGDISFQCLAICLSYVCGWCGLQGVASKTLGCLGRKAANVYLTMWDNVWSALTGGGLAVDALVQWLH